MRVETFKNISLMLLVIVGVLLIATICLLASTGFDLAYISFWQPKYENVQREVFENTKSYNQGMIQEVQNMQFEYSKATESQKPALRKIILHRVADFDLNKMPYDLQVFIQELKNEETK